MDKPGQQNDAIYSQLGKKSTYESQYNPNHLYAIPRQSKREEIGIQSDKLPFKGFDIWNHYEVSWLDLQGKPIVAIATIIYDCASSHIVESKSLKLYFNSLNNSHFETIDKVQAIINSDLTKILGETVTTTLKTWSRYYADDQLLSRLEGTCIDHLEITCDKYLPDRQLLQTEADTEIEECLVSDLLKSNCLVTNQPDWGSIRIHYVGKKIDHASLLQYIVSFRNHNEFHEQCVERIFIDIMQQCQPKILTVYARYTRRGGIDINPLRSTEQLNAKSLNQRLIRQ